MTYSSQPGYPTPQYGQPRPPGQQQNNLWLVGGAILVILVIIMTVILLVVQKTTESNSGDGGSGDGATTEGDGGDDGGDPDGGETTDYEDLGSAEFTSDACSAFDMTAFETAYGSYDPEQTYTSASNSGGLASLSCTFYNDDFDSVTMRLYDYESLEDVLPYIESDEDYYTEADGYEFSDYTAMGDAGSLYSSGDETYRTVNLHVALGSVEVSIYTSWYEGVIDDETALTLLEDFLRQCDQMFAEFK